tara:strand:+ start:545 stop:805 length:261 start_codon:yes stop_codon:yes gene_type:complete
MTSITIVEQNPSIDITDVSKTVNVESTQTNTVEIASEGPAGAIGGTFAVNETGKTDKSILYWDGSSNVYKANSTWTVSTLVHGGNF